MPRPPRHLSDADLLNAVRERLDTDPDISQAELRAAVGGTQSVVSAAMRAVLVERGRLQLHDGAAIDPRFAPLIRMPEPTAPLDLRSVLTSELTKPVSDHIAALGPAVDAVVARVHAAALDAIDNERARAASIIEAADRRADRAELYVDALRREVSEAIAETERVRSASAEEQGKQRLQVAQLERDLSEARSECARTDAAHRMTVGERDAARADLANARDKFASLDRELIAANARVQELERSVSGLTERLAQATQELAEARASEAESRASAAAARATAEAHEAIIRRIDLSPSSRRPKSARKPN